MFRGDLLELRTPTEDDCQYETQWNMDYETCKWFYTGAVTPPNYNPKWSEPNTSGKRRFSLWTLSVPKFIGTAYIFDIDDKNRNAWISYVVLPEARSQGYGTEAVRLLVRYAFHELNLVRLGAKVIDGNHGSLHLLGKCGFKREGLMRWAVFRGGAYHDLVIMGLLNDECGDGFANARNSN